MSTVWRKPLIMRSRLDYSRRHGTVDCRQAEPWPLALNMAELVLRTAARP